jgi:F-type H+-transporting ATPase subunit a
MVMQQEMALTFVNLLGASDPLGHVLDRPLIEGSESLGPWLTMNTLTLFVAGLLTIWVLRSVAGAIGTGSESEGNERYVTKGRAAQVFEVIIVYLRDTIIRPQLGGQSAKWTPFLLTLFFFILFNNLLGLLPLLDIQHAMGATWGDSHFAIFGGTPTGRIAVTGALAILAFILWQYNGIRSIGIVAWLKHYLGGAPWYLAPVMVPVEIMGTFVKPGALAIRLFANMTAGHVLLAVVLGFTALVPNMTIWLGGPVWLISLTASVVLYMLELFVAFLQAFIFMFLTTVFIAQLLHHEHDEHAHAEKYDAEHPMVDDLAAPVSA